MLKYFLMFKQQAIGTIKFAIPILSAIILYPPFITTQFGRLVLSGACGSYIAYTHYKTTKSAADILQFSPQDSNVKAHLDELIRSCNIDPKKVNVWYAFTNYQFALTIFDTIVIDPLIWVGLEDDKQAQEAISTLENYVLPYTTYSQYTYIQEIQNIFSVPVQNFFFRHELGHVKEQYSWKFIVSSGILGAFAVYAGLLIGLKLKALGLISALIAVIITSLLDLISTYIWYATFKYHEEKSADYFAAEYSTIEEILATADFFEAQQKLYTIYLKPTTIIAKLPARLLNGYMDGKDRAKFLRILAEHKESMFIKT